MTAALAKWGITIAFIALAFAGLPKWLAAGVGFAIAISASICGIAGLAILVFAGFFWFNRSYEGEPPSTWHIVKWSMIGAAMFFFWLSVNYHPFEMAKMVSHFWEEPSQDDE